MDIQSCTKTKQTLLEKWFGLFYVALIDINCLHVISEPLPN